MATYEDIIKQAYVAVNVIQDTSETISSTLRDNALAVLNQLLSSDSANRLMGYNVVHQGSLTLVAGTVAYTFGTGGTLVASARPVAITGWKVTSGAFVAGGEPVGFDVLRKAQQNATGKASVLPELLAADQAYPSINIEVFPAPASSPGTLSLDYWSPLTAVAYGDTVTVPEGWERYMVLGLAVELSPRYPMEGGRPELDRNWTAAKTAITARVAAILGGGAAPVA
jgi:hypothetical protein